ncbi:hypothetical protein DY000_02018550 [Brassica cretica]|uniref:NAC domain-containing protein n=1 Tax=Brassica cretica TaxID=69181 RepID=A0ABQ7D2H5_BRACR|nr:hypothetical protein DY000_02018550 [Brassica cretica]
MRKWKQTSITYGKCVNKIHGVQKDYCSHFLAGGKEGTPEAFFCRSCGCHLCFHEKEVEKAENSRPRHGYNISFDGSSNLESIEAKKAMALDKVAELWVVDPKRAKRRSWLVDSNRIATKIKNASAPSGVEQQSYKTLSQLVLYFFQEVDDWPGLPRGVKFDPSDPEIICHLLAKSGLSGLSSHPFTNELISAVNQDDVICYTHPKNLAG